MYSVKSKSTSSRGGNRKRSQRTTRRSTSSSFTQHRYKRPTLPTANTVLVVDASHSMQGELVCPDGQKISKRDAAVEAAVLLVKHKAANCPQDLLGCVGFGSRPFVVSPLTRASHPKLVKRLHGLRLCGMTDMSGGLRLGISLLSNRPARFLRNLVLLSDGYPDVRSGLMGLAREAKRARINIHTIGIGDRTSLDEVLLQRISAETHRGRYQHVTSLQELAIALQGVG